MNRVIAYNLLTAAASSYKGLAAEELANFVGKQPSATKRGEDGIDYLVEIAITRVAGKEAGIRVSGSVLPADWGAPHDRLDESFMVPASAGQHKHQ